MNQLFKGPISGLIWLLIPITHTIFLLKLMRAYDKEEIIFKPYFKFYIFIYLNYFIILDIK